MPQTRRQFLAQSSLAAAAFATPRLFAQATAQAATTVTTRQGPIRGLTADGVRIFRGVPFAQPPIGPLRFMPPLPLHNPHPEWTETYDATKFSASPMQSGEPGITQSEDCLYLNLWTPDTPAHHFTPYPVFVWIHGGGFTGGHAFEPVYDGSQFAREGIICITVAYRLGVFGFLDLEPILGPAYAGSANNALIDLIASLQWIQQNIAAFGGDPKRVTIGGESAGAKLTDILMGIPSAQPLFHQMISESGGAERVWHKSTSTGVTKGFAAAFQKATGQDPKTLATIPAADIISIQHDFLETWPQHFPLRAEIDGTLIPRLPIDTIASGSTKGKRLLIGTNRDESALFVGPHPNHDPEAKDLGNLSTAAFDPVFAKYATLYPEMTDIQRRIRALTAEEYWIPSTRVADAHTRSGGQTFTYRLDFAEASGRLSGYAYHSLDVGLVWDKPHAAVSNASAEATLATQMHTAWAAFIRGDVPAAPGLPAWPAYNLATRPTMLLNTQSEIATNPNLPELHLWDRIL